MYRRNSLTFEDVCCFLLFGSREGFPQQGLLIFSPLYSQMASPLRSQRAAPPAVSCAGVVNNTGPEGRS